MAASLLRLLFSSLSPGIVRIRPQFFICWITFHFKEFQSAAIGKKLNLVPTHTNCSFLHQSNFLFPISNVISDKTLEIELGPKRCELFIHCLMVQCYTSYCYWLPLEFFILNVENQCAMGNEIQLNKKGLIMLLATSIQDIC